MPLLLLLLFVIAPIVELYVIIQVGQAVGVLATIGLLVASSVLGVTMMRVQGRAAWARFTAAVRAGRPPAEEAIDGALVLLGGALLLAPGFVSDVLGLLLLVPPTRAALRKLAFGQLLGSFALAYSIVRPGGRGRGDDDVEGTARDVPAREPERLDP